MRRKKKTELQGQYLKEVGISMVVKRKLTPKQVEVFVYDIVKILGLELVSININELAPGFDVLATIKESFVYFGYWGETKYCRIVMSSCKTFSLDELIKRIKYYFTIRGHLIVELHRDNSIEEEVKKCLI